MIGHSNPSYVESRINMIGIAESTLFLHPYWHINHIVRIWSWYLFGRKRVCHCHPMFIFRLLGLRHAILMCCGNWDVFKWFPEKPTVTRTLHFICHSKGDRATFTRELKTFDLWVWAHNNTINTFPQSIDFMSNQMLSHPAPATKKLQHKFKVLNPQGTLLCPEKRKNEQRVW